MENGCKIFMNRHWLYSPEFCPEMTEKGYTGQMEDVSVPHAAAEMPCDSSLPTVFGKVSAYRKTFATEPGWAGKTVLLRVEAAAHRSEVYLNGKLLCTHCCGYTAFSADLTPALADRGKENVLCIKVDSRDSLDQPPFGSAFDCITYCGIYRDVYLEVKNPVYIEDVFVTTKKNAFTSRVTLCGGDALDEGCAGGAGEAGYLIEQELFEWQPDADPELGGACGGAGAAASGAGEAFGEVGFSARRVLASVSSGVRGKTTFTSAAAAGVRQWNLESPALYCLRTALLDLDGNEVDVKTVRFGFREVAFDASGFYLNGIKIKIRGLNRHQVWPYVGYAMPKNMQRDDADILKYELGVNEVCTSHCPQSRHFVERCDEIGLLVFTEIPGFKHVGQSSAWRKQYLKNVRDMVLQYRNNPSVFMWGVSINGSPDGGELYEKADSLCKSLDPSRPTSVERCIKKSHRLKEGHTEFTGQICSAKSSDFAASGLANLALRHAATLDSEAQSEGTAFASGVCAFDYSPDGCHGYHGYHGYHDGVMDMFRNPKASAALYKSQGEASLVGDVLELSCCMGFSCHCHPALVRGGVWAFTNADFVRVLVNGEFVKEYSAKEHSPFHNLLHGPILIDDFIGGRLEAECGIKAGDAEKIKRLLFAMRDYGSGSLPLKLRVMRFFLFAKKAADRKKINAWYSKYIGDMGNDSAEYRFDAVTDGRVVASCVKSSSGGVFVQVAARRTALVEDECYDVAAVQIVACDGEGNVSPSCQEAVSLCTEGPVSLIGPATVLLKEGMAGAYVCTCAKDMAHCEEKAFRLPSESPEHSGGGVQKAALVVTDWLGREARVEFTVVVKNVREV